jgi:hypothetical protein
VTFIPAAACIAEFDSGPVEVRRYDAPTQNAFGGHDLAPKRTITLPSGEVTVAPASPRDMNQVPEADRNLESICVYSVVRLRVADEGFGADRVCWDDRIWRVVSVRNLETQGGAFISVAALEEPEA